VRIALVGFGVVGQAFAQRLLSTRDPASTPPCPPGFSPTLVAVSDRSGWITTPRSGGLPLQRLLEAKAHNRPVASLHDPAQGLICMPSCEPSRLRQIAADVLIETGPSDLKDPHPAMQRMLQAMASGKHVVSAGKAALATAMPALLEVAQHNRVRLQFSAAVGAGTPMLATAATIASSDQIESLDAIINGTTNFILWRMFTFDEPFDAALQEAIKLGYAETDPSNDIDGIDTAMKLVILANHAMKRSITIDQVSIEGIRHLSLDAVRVAKAAGQVIKLLGTVSQHGHASVKPVSIDASEPLNVPKNVNALRLTTARCGPVTLVGRGAGGAETATAIFRDLLAIYRAELGAV
jgi:homoserine dehydrogenase